MLRLTQKLMLVASIGMAVAACQDSGYAQRGSYPSAPAGYNNPYYNSGYPAPAPSQYGYAQPGPNYNYANQQGTHGWTNTADGRRYTTVTVTNRGQNGFRDDVVQQQVVCGSQYSDGYRTRTAPQC